MSSAPDPAPSDLQQQLATLQATVATLAETPRRRGPGAWPLVVVLVAALAWSEDAFGLRTSLAGPEGGSAAAQPAADARDDQESADGHSALDASAPVVDGAPGEEPDPRPLRATPEPDVAALQARLDEVIAERNEHFGDVLRLRNQVVELEQRISALIQLREQVEERPQAAPARITSTETRTPDPWLDALHDALQGSGVSHLRVVEGRLHDGRLHDVLLAELDLMGHTRDVRHVSQIALTSEAGAVFLELTPEVDPLVLQHVGEPEVAAGLADEAPAETVTERLRLARWDAALWRPTGLALPLVLVPVEEVQLALSGLLAGQGFEVKRLGGFDGGQLLDVQLIERVGDGMPVTELRAARAVIVADGPALLLYDGEVVRDGEARAFYKGRHKLPLPGADHAAWRAAIGG